MAIFPTNSSDARTMSPTITMSTQADAISYVLPIECIRWHLTTGASSTWALHMTQSTATAASTAGWPWIGSTGPVFLGGTPSTALFTAPTGNGYLDFTINNWCFGAVLSTISGGFVEIIKGAPGRDWVINKPPIVTTV